MDAVFSTPLTAKSGSSIHSYLEHLVWINRQYDNLYLPTYTITVNIDFIDGGSADFLLYYNLLILLH